VNPARYLSDSAFCLDQDSAVLVCVGPTQYWDE